MVTTSIARFGFSLTEKLRTQSLPSHRFIEPQGTDIHPSPLGIPQQAANNAASFVFSKQRNSLVSIIRRMETVVIEQAVVNKLFVF
jgi:hypothetical protein